MTTAQPVAAARRGRCRHGQALVLCGLGPRICPSDRRETAKTDVGSLALHGQPLDPETRAVRLDHADQAAVAAVVILAGSEVCGEEYRRHGRGCPLL